MQGNIDDGSNPAISRESAWCDRPDLPIRLGEVDVAQLRQPSSHTHGPDGHGLGSVSAGDGSDSDADSTSSTTSVAKIQRLSSGLLSVMDTHARHARIGSCGSLSLLANNMLGPGMVTLCAVYQDAGWLPTSAALLMIWMLSTLAASMLCEAIVVADRTGRSKDSHHRKHPDHVDVELCTLAKAYVPRWVFLSVVVLFIVNMQSRNIAAVVESSQTLDGALVCAPTRLLLRYLCVGTNLTTNVFALFADRTGKVSAFGGTCAVEFYPNVDTYCIDAGSNSTTNSPFDRCDSDGQCQSVWVASLGYLLSAVLTLPMGLYNLEEVVWFQILCFYGTICVCAVWLYQFEYKINSDHDHDLGSWQRLPVATANQRAVFGTVLYNYAFVMTVPSWFNEKAPSVSTAGSLWFSGGIVTPMYIAIGVVGALAYHIVDGDDVLTLMLISPLSFPVTKVRRCLYFIALFAPVDVRSYSCCVSILYFCCCITVSAMKVIGVYCFSVLGLISSIPVFSIIVRYNLLSTGLIKSGCVANLYATVAPWIVALLVYAGPLLSLSVNWTGLLTTAPLNFTLPAWLYIKIILRPPRATKDEVHGTSAEVVQQEMAPCERESSQSNSECVYVRANFTDMPSWYTSSSAWRQISRRHKKRWADFEATRYQSLPRGWSIATKETIAWSIIYITLVLNVFAIVVAMLGAYPKGGSLRNVLDQK
eukprot:SAG31_NODE_351_length_17237_cov_7.010445_8_plen_703_part_00